MANRITHKDVTFHVGDLIKVHQTIKEGDKSRTQIFEGIVIAIKANDDPTFIVRKIASGQIGVEKIFPINAPVITKIEVKKTATVRQAKLYYLRDRIGKRATKLKATKRKEV
ncbi:MAG: 50S ribosomal protein L19 [bacterium]